MELSVCLKALGDPTRFTIFQQLLIRKHCTRSLSKKLGFTEATISQHLKILHEAGLVYKEKYGYHMHYLPTQEALDFLASSFEGMRQASLALNRDPKVCQCEFRQQMENEPVKQIAEKEQNTMRIAVAYDNGQIFQHFGQTEQFKFYDVQDGEVKAAQVVSADGFSHEGLAIFLRQQQTDILICGGIGSRGRGALTDAGIKLYAGVQGLADDAAKALADGNLQDNPNADCDHHGHHQDDDCGHPNGDCGHHHERKHQFGDEDCKRSRQEGECRRDNGKCGHNHDEGECGHGHCHKD